MLRLNPMGHLFIISSMSQCRPIVPRINRIGVPQADKAFFDQLSIMQLHGEQLFQRYPQMLQLGCALEPHLGDRQNGLGQ